MDSKGKHIPRIQKQSYRGTTRYVSVDALKYYDQSRKDDLESLGYMFAYFLKGTLPWIGLMQKYQNGYEHVLNSKSQTTAEQLFAKQPNFVKYLDYVRNLAFDAQPDYELCISHINSELIGTPVEKLAYDWQNQQPLMKAKPAASHTNYPGMTEPAKRKRRFFCF